MSCWRRDMYGLRGALAFLPMTPMRATKRGNRSQTNKQVVRRINLLEPAALRKPKLLTEHVAACAPPVYGHHDEKLRSPIGLANQKEHQWQRYDESKGVDASKAKTSERYQVWTNRENQAACK